MKKFLLFALLTIVSVTVFGQEPEAKSEEKKEGKAEEKTEFKLTGKPIVTIYANYSAGLGHANGENGFALERSYLGYQFNVTKNLGGRVVFDVGPTKVPGADLERVAYVKNAMLTWKPGQFTLDFGLVKTEQFSLQEDFWGYRYIWKSLQDEYKFSSSADMGVIAKYRFNKFVSADVSFTNGEGYKKLNKDNNNRYGAGVTLTPMKALVLRAYYDSYGGDGEDAKTQQTLSLFAGYKHKLFSLGLEYNKMWNSDFVDKQDKTGYSAYGTVNLNDKFSLFGRYDDLTSRDHYFKGDERRGIVGLQYQPIRYLRISPNFQTFNPSAGKASNYLFLNVEFKI